MGKQVITRVYQVIKRDGRIVSFDISKIAIAIEKAFEAVHDIDDEIDAISRSILDEMEKKSGSATWKKGGKLQSVNARA